MIKMPPRSADTLLLEIFERLGGIEAEQKSQAKQHGEMAGDLKEVRTKVENFASVAIHVERMNPIVEDYEKSKNRAIGVLFVICVLSSGLGFLASKVNGWIFGH